MAAPLLLHVYSTFSVGGAQVRFAAVANRFPGRWRHAIIAMDGDTACRERLAPGVEVEFPEVTIRKGDTLGNLRRFRRVLQRLRPQALVTSNWGSIEWAMANAGWPGRPGVVRHVHVEDGFGPEERISQLRRRVLTRRLVLRRSLVVVPSRVLWGIATDTWKLDPRRLRYIANGIDLERFAEVEFAGPPVAAPPVVGTVAALRAEKNIGRLLRAFRLAEAPGRLVVVGDGPERTGLEALAGDLGIAGQVDFTGYDGQPQGRYRGFDLFALSSDTEQMPLSVLEAMATALPVAATDVGDIRAMLAAENAPYLAARDDAALGAALAALMRLEPSQRRAIGAANRAKVLRDYDQETMFSAYADLFDGAYAA